MQYVSIAQWGRITEEDERRNPFKKPFALCNGFTKILFACIDQCGRKENVMKRRGKFGRRWLILTALVVIGIQFGGYSTAIAEEAAKTVEPTKLLVVWTSADREVANNMVFMYTYNAKKNNWWKEVRLLIWGPSQKLLARDKELQDYLKKMKDAGVELIACQACSDGYGISEDLRKLGITVEYVGVPFTEMLKSGWKTLTF